MQYIDDIPKVRRIDNKTIISEVNGCGPKVERFLSVSKAENVFLDYIATKHNLEFEPACNAHDICYDCKVKKDECDNLMFVNIKKKYVRRNIQLKILILFLIKSFFLLTVWDMFLKKIS